MNTSKNVHSHDQKVINTDFTKQKILLFITLFPFCTVVDWTCRTGWFYRAGTCYRFLSHATVPWKTAHDLCQQNSGQLPVITDTELMVRKSLLIRAEFKLLI